ncbi:MAG: 2-hydroxyglutaryl-CoA dehydratase [Lachnospiraceae bacterium]|nr:2-hydroxyglutaryl-CoA dehydratase [Lachnospiraceae bacterium]MBP5250598.1 2-hydroxyglutaryl-CoA dehydratase [Lachnospiraceae bacterium]
MRQYDILDSKYKGKLDGFRTIGVDIGSRAAKGVLLIDGEIFCRMVPSGVSSINTAHEMVDALLKEAGLSKYDIDAVVGTGYGRVAMSFENIPFFGVTEITCHGIGAHLLNAATRTIVDIGGQDSKVIRIDPANGKVDDFVMNDKCAAGTGRFLEKVAMILDVGLEELGEISLQADEEIEISSQCVVFAESEVISLRSKGVSKANIAAAIHRATARRIQGLLKRVGFEETMLFTGGVSKNKGMRKAITEVTGVPIGETSLDTTYAGALGAAYIAATQAGIVGQNI